MIAAWHMQAISYRRISRLKLQRGILRLRIMANIPNSKLHTINDLAILASFKMKEKHQVKAMCHFLRSTCCKTLTWSFPKRIAVKKDPVPRALNMVGELVWRYSNIVLSIYIGSYQKMPGIYCNWSVSAWARSHAQNTRVLLCPFAGLIVTGSFLLQIFIFHSPTVTYRTGVPEFCLQPDCPSPELVAIAEALHLDNCAGGFFTAVVCVESHVPLVSLEEACWVR